MNTKKLFARRNLLMGLIPVVCVCSEAGQVQPEGQTNHPGVVCMDSDFDFGVVYPEAVVKHSYVMTNQGGRVVKIIAVRPSCGCTTAQVATNELAPGLATTVDVVLDFKGRRGRQNKSIYVETDDSENRIVRLGFNGVVMVPIEAQPEGVHFGTISSEGLLEREVLLTAVSTNTFKVLSVKSASPQVTVSFEPREAGKQYLLRIACPGARKLGTFMTAVEVETDHPQMKMLSIPVAGFVAGDIVPAPAELLLFPSATNEPKTVWVSLWSPAGKPFKVTKVELPGEGMTNAVISVKPDRCRLEIKTWGSLMGLDGKSIRIETDLDSLKELSIPLKVMAVR